MKRLVTVVGIIALVFGLSFCGIFYAGDTRKEMFEMISQAQALCDRQDSQSLVLLAEKMTEQWERRAGAVFGGR